MTVILLRHARSTSNTAGVLAGRSGVDLDEKGREQATGLIDRIGDLPIRAVASSPMLRCQRTVEPLAEALCLEPLIDDRFSEVDYGEWTGRKIGDLVDEPLWRGGQGPPPAAGGRGGGGGGGGGGRGADPVSLQSAVGFSALGSEHAAIAGEGVEELGRSGVAVGESGIGYAAGDAVAAATYLVSGGSL